nr:hypothetical protein [Sulfolobus islandicus]
MNFIKIMKIILCYIAVKPVIKVKVKVKIKIMHKRRKRKRKADVSQND